MGDAVEVLRIVDLDPAAPDDLYLQALGAPFTVNTVPEATLRAYYDHGHAPSAMPADGGDSDATLAEFAAAGVDVCIIGLGVPHSPAVLAPLAEALAPLA